MSVTRREFLKSTVVAGSAAIAGLAAESLAATDAPRGKIARKPNVVFVFADQWRAQATGYAGDPNARTPNIDRLMGASVNFRNAVSPCPVCSPYRASLITGRRVLTHGVFMNDVCLSTEAVSLAQAFTAAGYDTGYIGKWHIDGHGRSNFTPRERRQGFDFWNALECTHNYNKSLYYADDDAKLFWDGYDSIAQTRRAQKYIRDHAASAKPFLLVMSWGPPHDPYPTAPEKYREMFHPDALKLRPNVPEDFAAQARTMLAGYYAHCAAQDDCIGDLLATLSECKIDGDTIFVFTSDHGDMLGSHGQRNKQQPYDESACVPFLVRYPGFGDDGRTNEIPLETCDIMPTLLGLAGAEIPKTVEGMDLSGVIRADKVLDKDAALLTCPQPFGQWTRARGGKEYRGVRTWTHTYVRDLQGPWLLFDNRKDPYQQTNLVGQSGAAARQKDLDSLLTRKLKQTGDEFLPGPKYLEKWGYKVYASGTVPYKG